MIKRITSKDNPALKTFRQLQTRKYRERLGEFVLEGPTVISEALEQGTPIRMAVFTDDFREDPKGRALIRKMEEERIPLYCTEEGLFRDAAGTQTPQGVLAAAKIPYWDPDILTEEGSCFLVLDRVQDPGNIGTMVRTAEAAGFRGIVAVKGTADLYSGKVSRAAAGGLLRLPVFTVDSGAAGRKSSVRTRGATSMTTMRRWRRTSPWSSATRRGASRRNCWPARTFPWAFPWKDGQNP